MGNNILSRSEHKIYIERKRRELKNKCPSIIANNCNGGIIAHDLGLQFNSPTVNIGIWPKDYIKFLNNIKYYLSITPVDSCESAYDGELFLIDDIKVLFTHVSSAEEGLKNWERRKKRIDYDNLFVLFCDKIGCTYDDIKAFDALPLAHKVIFTHKPYPEIKSAYYIPGFENDGEVGVLSEWKPGFLKRRWLDDFDYVAFLNGEIYNFEGEKK